MIKVIIRLRKNGKIWTELHYTPEEFQEHFMTFSRDVSKLSYIPFSDFKFESVTLQYGKCTIIIDKKDMKKLHKLS